MNNNKRVLSLIKKRLNLGQEKYGQSIPLAGEGGRDNLKEALEEIFDLVVYLAATLIELADERFYKNEEELQKEQQIKGSRDGYWENKNMKHVNLWKSKEEEE